MTDPDPNSNSDPDSDPDSAEDLEETLKDVPVDPNIDDISDEDLLRDDEDDILDEAAHFLGGTPTKVKRLSTPGKKAGSTRKTSPRKNPPSTTKRTPTSSRRKTVEADDLSLDEEDDPLLAEMEQILSGKSPTRRPSSGSYSGTLSDTSISSSKFIPKAAFARFQVKIFLGCLLLNLIAAVGLRLPEILSFTESGPNWGLLIPELIFLGVDLAMMFLFLVKPSISFLLLFGSTGWNILYEVIVRFVLHHAHPFGLWGSFIFTVVASGLLLYCGYHAVLTIHEEQ